MRVQSSVGVSSCRCSPSSARLLSTWAAVARPAALAALLAVVAAVEVVVRAKAAAGTATVVVKGTERDQASMAEVVVRAALAGGYQVE